MRKCNYFGLITFKYVAAVSAQYERTTRSQQCIMLRTRWYKVQLTTPYKLASLTEFPK